MWRNLTDKEKSAVIKLYKMDAASRYKNFLKLITIILLATSPAFGIMLLAEPKRVANGMKATNWNIALYLALAIVATYVLVNLLYGLFVIFNVSKYSKCVKSGLTLCCEAKCKGADDNYYYSLKGEYRPVIEAYMGYESKLALVFKHTMTTLNMYNDKENVLLVRPYGSSGKTYTYSIAEINTCDNDIVKAEISKMYWQPLGAYQKKKIVSRGIKKILLALLIAVIFSILVVINERFDMTFKLMGIAISFVIFLCMFIFVLYDISRMRKAVFTEASLVGSFSTFHMFYPDRSKGGKYRNIYIYSICRSENIFVSSDEISSSVAVCVDYSGKGDIRKFKIIPMG